MGYASRPEHGEGLNHKIYAQIETWLNRPIQGNHPYVFLNGLWLKRSWGGEVRNVSLLVAIGVSEVGYREVLVGGGRIEGRQDELDGLLRHSKERGLKGLRLFVSDKCLGWVESLGEFYPEALWQRCIFNGTCGLQLPTSKVKEVAAMLKAIHVEAPAGIPADMGLNWHQRLISARSTANNLLGHRLQDHSPYYHRPCNADLG